MADKAHIEIDKRLAVMENRLSEIYRDATNGIEQKAREYFARFEALDEKKRQMLNEGKITEDEYLTWRKNKMLYGKRFAEMKRQIAAQWYDVNNVALSYINGEIPEVYVTGYNAIESDLDGIGDYSFTTVNADAIRELATAEKIMLPYKKLDSTKDIPWNVKSVNTAVLQGILQGESIPKIAARVAANTCSSNMTSAIRNARTMVTSSENLGRMDSYKRAQDDGISMKKEWIATFDYRTRHAHAFLDGQLADVDEAFKSELGDIMYPGDPNAHPSNVYNCRCTIAAKILGFNGEESRSTREERQNVSEWLDKKKENNPEAFDIAYKKIYNESGDRKQYKKYRERLGIELPNGGFSAFQKLKYTDPDGYEDLKGYYRYKGRVPEARHSDFEKAMAIKDLGIVGTIRVPAKQMTIKNLTSKNDHAFRHGCTIEDAKKYLANAQVSITREKWDGVHTNYYSQDGAVYFDSNGKINTIFSRKDFDLDTEKMMEVME